MRTLRFKVCLKRFSAPNLVADDTVFHEVSLHRLVNPDAFNNSVTVEILYAISFHATQSPTIQSATKAAESAGISQLELVEATAEHLRYLEEPK